MAYPQQVRQRKTRLIERFAKTCMVSSLALLAGGGTFAQEQSTSSGTSKADAGLQEVIVTATKRSSSVEKTPISISAVSGEDLQDRGLADFASLAAETPGISMKSSGPGQSEFEMRGLSSNGGSSPTVGFYLDDAPVTAPASAQTGKVVIDPNLYDLNRVEVLRGPQGTLYGSGSMGGTIKLISNQPDTHGYAASAQAILSGTEGGGINRAENAMGNIPVIDGILAVRAVVSESNNSGWIDRVVLNPFPALTANAPGGRGNILAAPVQQTNKNANDEELEGARISVLFTPNDRFSLYGVLFDQRIMQGGENTFDSDPGKMVHYQPFNVAEPFKDDFVMANGTATYKFDSFEVTSTTSHWTRSVHITQDLSEVLYQGFGAPGFTVASGGLGIADLTENDKTHQTSEELRAASSGDGRFQWLGGLFYSDFVSDFNLKSFVNGLIPITGFNDIINQVEPTRVTQEAAFGNVSYQITDALKLTGGLRYFQYETKLDMTQSGLFSGSGSPANFHFADQSKDHGINPMLNLSYQVSDPLMLYATAAKGFRPGGGNQPIPTTGTVGAGCLANLRAFGHNSAPTDYKPDDVWSYEVGEKYKLGNSFSLNADVYRERWGGVQQSVTLGCGFSYTDNLGTGVINGGEVEAKAVLLPGLIFSGSAGYADATLIENVPASGTVKGQAIQDISPWTANVALTYSFSVNSDWEAMVRANYDFTDGKSEPSLAGDGRLPSYATANIRASIFNEKWSATLFVNNLTDKHARVSIPPSLAQWIPENDRITTNRPLTAGLDVSYHF